MAHSGRRVREPSTARALEAIAAVLGELGVDVVEPGVAVPSDVPIVWMGSTLAYARPASVDSQFDRAVRAVERQIGSRLADVATSQRREAIRLLSAAGVFQVRGSVQRLADSFGRSRSWVYLGLSEIRRSAAGAGGVQAERESD